MGLLTFKGGVHPNDGKSLAKDKAIVELLPQGDLVYPLSQPNRLKSATKETKGYD